MNWSGKTLSLGCFLVATPPTMPFFLETCLHSLLCHNFLKVANLGTTILPLTVAMGHGILA